MPRVRSAAPPASAQKRQGAEAPYASQLTAVQQGLGTLGLSAGSLEEDELSSAADAAADSYADGRVFRAYGHDARIFDLGFHPASADLLVSASDDCTAGVWVRQQGGTAAGGRYMQVASFQGHADSVMRAAWSPDGGMVASGSSDGVVCLWQPTEAALTARRNLGHAGTRQLASLEGHPEEVYGCIFLPGNATSSSSNPSSSSGPGASSGNSTACQRLVAASGESLFLWDLPTRTLLQQVEPPLLPDAAAGSDHQVPERWRPGYLFGVAAQPDGPLLGAACSDGRLRLWAREGGDSCIRPLCTLPWNQAMGSDCVFGSNSLFCAVSKDGSLIAMDLRQGGCLQHLQLEAPLMSCTLLPGGSGGSGITSGQLLVASAADGRVHIVDIGTGEVSSLFPEAAPPRPLLCAALSSDGTALAVSGEAVVLEEDDLASSATQQPAGPGPPGHQPLSKWSPIHIWHQTGSSRSSSSMLGAAHL